MQRFKGITAKRIAGYFLLSLLFSVLAPFILFVATRISGALDVGENAMAPNGPETAIQWMSCLLFLASISIAAMIFMSLASVFDSGQYLLLTVVISVVSQVVFWFLIVVGVSEELTRKAGRKKVE